MLVLYAITIFISAAMLFVAELMFAKMVLPLLGGTPAVWNTCSVFFQAALLAGYAYAHWTSTRLKVRTQIWAHAGLLLLPLLVLPIAIPGGWHPPVSANPIPSLLLLMVMALGLPFTMVSTSAPLIQRWFAHTGHKAGKDPYFLYAASNAGSFAGLIGYIAFLEPNFTRHNQSNLWHYGYMVLIALTFACAFAVIRAQRAGHTSAADESAIVSEKEAEPANAGKPVTLWRSIRWVLLAAVPSSLLLGFTTFLTTDITAAPLLWVVPLSLYLITFMLAFSRRRFIPQRVLTIALPMLVLIQLLVLTAWSMALMNMQYVAALHMLTFFIAALACHTALADDRPGTQDLTRYYLLTSVGGALGGIFNALIAPVVFKSVAEYPISLVLACVLCIPFVAYKKGSKQRRPVFGTIDTIWVACFAILLFLVVFLSGKFGWLDDGRYLYVMIFLALACYAAIGNPIRFGACLALTLIAMNMGFGIKSGIIFQARSFFGVLKVVHNDEFNVNCFYHGTTMHGMQCMDPKYRRVPYTYFMPSSPIGKLFLYQNKRGLVHNVGVIGLGDGTLASYAERGQNYTFYEIDPAVRDVATNPEYFTFLSDAQARGAKVNIVLGDGRLTLADAPDHSFDIIVFDAFASDSVPIHLITREAIDLYVRKLNAHGIIIFNITNRFVDLRPVIGNVCNDAGLACMHNFDQYLSDQDVDQGKAVSHWMFAARDWSDFGRLANAQGWEHVQHDPTVSLWTDDHSNILEAIQFLHNRQQ